MVDPPLTSARARWSGIVVAIGVVALSLPNGGYYPRATAIATLCAWWVVLVGCASGVVPRARPGRAALAAVGALGALALWMAASLIWSHDVGKGFIDLVRATGYAGLGLAAVLTIRASTIRPVLAGLAAGTTVVVGLGLLSRYFPNLFDTGRTELEASFTSALGRLAFPLGYWNAFAGMAALNLVLLGGFAVAAARRWIRTVAGGLIPLSILAIFLSSSRGGAVSAAVGAAALLVLADRRERWIAQALPGVAIGASLVLLAHGQPAFASDLGNAAAASQGRLLLVLSVVGVLLSAIGVYALEGRVRRLHMRSLSVRRAAAVAATLTAVALIAVLPGRLDSLSTQPGSSEVGGSAHLLSGSGSGRLQYWSTAVHAFRDEPIVGIGAGGYPAFWDKNGAIPQPTLNAHSLPLETLAELGLIGGLLLVVAALVPLISGLHRARTAPSAEMTVALALYATIATQSLIDWAWQVPALFSVAILVGAMLVAPATGPGSKPVPVTADRPRRVLAVRIVAVLASIAAIGSAGVQLFGQTKIDSARSALAAGDPAQALADAGDAASIEPWSSVPRLQRAMALVRLARPDEADAAIREAIERAPQDWTLRLGAQTIDLIRGDDVALGEDREQMLHLNPPLPSSADAG